MNGYKAAADGNWSEAMRMQHIWNSYLDDIAMPIIEEGYEDPAIDRAQFIASGFLKLSNRLRPPYSPVPNERIVWMRQQMLSKYPEMVYDTIA